MSAADATFFAVEFQDVVKTLIYILPLEIAQLAVQEIFYYYAANSASATRTGWAWGVLGMSTVAGIGISVAAACMFACCQTPRKWRMRALFVCFIIPVMILQIAIQETFNDAVPGDYPNLTRLIVYLVATPISALISWSKEQPRKFAHLLVREMKDLCRKHRLTTKGDAFKLQERLEDWDAAHPGTMVFRERPPTKVKGEKRKAEEDSAKEAANKRAKSAAVVRHESDSNSYADVVARTQSARFPRPPGWSLQDIKPGDHLDIMDSAKFWCYCKVVEVHEDCIHFDYVGWPGNWKNRCLPRDCPRIMPPLSRTGQVEGKTSLADSQEQFRFFDALRLGDEVDAYQWNTRKWIPGKVSNEKAVSTSQPSVLTIAVAASSGTQWYNYGEHTIMPPGSKCELAKKINVESLIVDKKQAEVLQCPICMDLIIEAVMCNNGIGAEDPCGHAFCKACIETSLRSKPECPCCRRPTTLAQLVPNMDRRRATRELMVRCPVEKCEWKGQLGKDNEGLQQHIESCKMTETRCADCQASFLRSEVKSHSEVCPKKPVQCPFCELFFAAELWPSHQGQCPEEEIQCDIDPSHWFTRRGAQLHAQHNVESHLITRGEQVKELQKVVALVKRRNGEEAKGRRSPSPLKNAITDEGIEEMQTAKRSAARSGMHIDNNSSSNNSPAVPDFAARFQEHFSKEEVGASNAAAAAEKPDGNPSASVPMNFT